MSEAESVRPKAKEKTKTKSKSQTKITKPKDIEDDIAKMVSKISLTESAGNERIDKLALCQVLKNLNGCHQSVVDFTIKQFKTITAVDDTAINMNDFLEVSENEVDQRLQCIRFE